MKSRSAWLVMAGSIAAMAAMVWAANLTWDGGDVDDSNWSSPDNWNPDQAPTDADVVHFTNSVVGTNVVDVSVQVAGLTYNNSTGSHVTVINDGVILTVSNYLRVGRASPGNTAVRITGPGGTLRMVGDIQVSGTNTGSLVMD